MTIENRIKSITQRLSNIAKKKEVPFQSLEMAYLIERMLSRILQDHSLSQKLVFKGGYVGLRAYNSNRYTVDLDALLIHRGLEATIASIRLQVEQPCGEPVWFQCEDFHDLRTQGEYGGKRIVFRAGIGLQPQDISRARLLHFDLGSGDPTVPAPRKVQTKCLISEKEFEWSIYSIETICAEKIHALVDREEGNSRSKDIFDLHIFLPQASKEDLGSALSACFQYRETALPKSLVVFVENLDTNILKRGWKNAVTSVKNPPTFATAISEVIELLKQKT